MYTIKYNSNRVVKIRLYDPATQQWWTTGTSWTATETSATLTTLTEKTLVETGQSRYSGADPGWPTGEYIVEYVDTVADPDEVIAEEHTVAIDSSGTTTLLSRVVGTIASGTHNPQSGDAYTRLGAPVGASVSADIAGVKSDSTAILADTSTDGVVVAAGSKSGYSLAGDQSGVTVGTVNALGTQAKADVNAEADTALADYDAPTNAEMTARTLAAADYGTSSAIAAVAGYVDTEITTIINHLTDIKGAGWTNENLVTVDGLIDTALARLTSARAGYLDKLNVSGTLAHSDAADTYKADVSGLMLDASYTAPDNAGVAAIKAKTDNLPSDPADQSLLETAITNATTNLSTLTAQQVWEHVTRSLTDKDDFTLTTDYDAAKTAGSQTSINSILTVINKIDTMLELNGALYRFTINALEQAEKDWSTDEKTTIKAILGVPDNGTIPEEPVAGALKTIPTKVWGYSG